MLATFSPSGWFMVKKNKNKIGSKRNKEEQYCEFSALNICQSGLEVILKGVVKQSDRQD